jgi:hypothetical protein
MTYAGPGDSEKIKIHYHALDASLQKNILLHFLNYKYQLLLSLG